MHDDVDATVRYGRAVAAADLRYAPSPSFAVRTRYQRATLGDDGAPGAPRYSTATTDVTWRPGAGAALNAGLDFAGANVTDNRRLRIGTSLLARSTYVRPVVGIVSSVGAMAAMTFGLSAESSFPFLLPAGSRVRTSFGDAHFVDRFLALAVPVARFLRVEAALEWPAAARQYRVTLSASLITRAFRYDARSTSTGSDVASSHSLSGSVAVGISGTSTPALTLSSGALRGRADVTGTVFLDDNRNGRLDAGETTLPGVSVIGTFFTTDTDLAGEYHTPNLTPFAPVMLKVDPLTLPSPGMLTEPVRVVPIPNATTRADLPVTYRMSGSTSGLALRDAAAVGGLAKNPERGDPATVHGDYLESGPGDPHPVSHAWQSPETREDVAAQRRPVAVGNVQIVVRPCIDE
jgi:hypothetical protein